MCFRLSRAAPLGLKSVILLVWSLRREEAVPAGVTGIQRAGRARAVAFDCPKQRAVTVCGMAGVKLGRAACPADHQELAQKCWSRRQVQPELSGIRGSDLAAGPGWDRLWGKALREALGVVPPSCPRSSGGLRSHPCLLKAFGIISCVWRMRRFGG